MSNNFVENSIWQSVTGFVKKHKSKIIMTGVAAATVGSLIYYYYQQNNTRTVTNSSHSHEETPGSGALTEQEKEQLTKRLGYLFEENRKTADKGIRTLLPSTKGTILSIIDVEKLIARLKQQQQQSSGSTIEDAEAGSASASAPPQPLSKEEKRKIWEQLKIDSFTRLISSVYSLNLSFMLFSIQVNILGRYIFLLQQKEELKSSGSFDSEAAQVPNVNYEIQQQFLSYAAFFQKQGINKLIQKVEQLVLKHIGSLPLSEKVTAETLCEYMELIRLDLQDDLSKAATNTNTQFLSSDNLVHYLLPDEQEDEKKLLIPEQQQAEAGAASTSGGNEKILLLLLDELRDYLESKEIVNVLNEISGNTFNVLFARMKHIMLSSSLQKMQKQEQQGAVAAAAAAGSCFIANIIPKVGSEAKNILSSTMDNEYLRAVEDCEYLQKFCAHVYSLGILDKLQ